MNCAALEKLIYNYRELNTAQQNEVRQHISTCDDCRNLHGEVVTLFQLTAKLSSADRALPQPNPFTEKVMGAVAGIAKKQESPAHSIPRWTIPMGRLALAAVSCGILLLFFIEVLVPDFKSGKITGPMANIQGAIIKSEDFRRAFSRSKEKKSLFADCKNALSNEVDPNCVREKIKNLNF